MASIDYVQKVIHGNFMQACHGKAAPLQRLKIDDGVIYYSLKLKFGSDKKCQAFTAIDRIVGESVYANDIGNGFIPFRGNVEYLVCSQVMITPLIQNLRFIKNKHNWGYIFRFGTIKIQQPHFELISSQMLPNSDKIEVVSVELATQ